MKNNNIKKTNVFDVINAIIYKKKLDDRLRSVYNQYFINVVFSSYKIDWLIDVMYELNLMRVSNEQHFTVLSEMVPKNIGHKRVIPKINTKKDDIYPSYVDRSTRDYVLMNGDKCMGIIQKYEPKTIDDMVLPEEIKQLFKKWISKPNDIPNILLSGAQGMGKTTMAKLLLNHLGVDGLFMNSGRFNSVDILRNEVSQYASQLDIQASLIEGIDKKFIIFDEFDSVSDTFQESFKGVVTEYKDLVTFILTTNHPHKIINHTKSRLSGATIDFDELFKKHKVEIVKQLLKKMVYIINEEGGGNIKYDANFLKEMIKMYYPDIRTIYNKLGYYIDKYGELTNIKILSLDSDNILNVLKKGNFEEIKKTAYEIYNFDEFYKALSDVLIKTKNIEAILLASDSNTKLNMAVNKNLHIFATMLRISKVL